jgi:hypothetical protein
MNLYKKTMKIVEQMSDELSQDDFNHIRNKIMRICLKVWHINSDQDMGEFELWEIEQYPEHPQDIWYQLKDELEYFSDRWSSSRAYRVAHMVSLLDKHFAEQKEREMIPA